VNYQSLKVPGIRNRLVNIYSVIFAVFLFVVVFCLAMNTPLDHDEHQYIACAKLISSHSLIPYFNFPFYHLPNILLVYSLIFKLTGYLLFGARTFSALCVWVTLLITYLTALRIFREKNTFLKLSIASFSVFFIFSNPVFIYTCGKAWNHDFPIMLTMLSFVFLYRALDKSSAGYTFLTGFLSGFAAGTRISFVPVVLPLIIYILVFPKTGTLKERLRLLYFFVAGIFVSFIPSLILFISYPGQFVFDVFSYHLQIDAQYLKSFGWYTPVYGRIEYFLHVISEPRNFLLTIAGIVFILCLKFYSLNDNKKMTELNIIIVVIPFLLIGSLIKPVIFYQYLYAPVPFIVLGTILGISKLKDKLQMHSLLLYIVLAGISIYSGGKYFWKVNKLSNPQNWLTVQYHNYGYEISKYTGKGKVLTLAPIFALEGGAEIYPEFSSSPFTWRTSEFVNTQIRKRMKIISKPDLDEFLKNDPPLGILTGFEEHLEGDLIRWGKENKFEKVPISQKALMVRIIK
jgi:hypothetical protein